MVRLSDEEIIRILDMVGGCIKGSYNRNEDATVYSAKEELLKKHYNSFLSYLPRLYYGPSCIESCQPKTRDMLKPVENEIELRINK